MRPNQTPIAFSQPNPGPPGGPTPPRPLTVEQIRLIMQQRIAAAAVPKPKARGRGRIGAPRGRKADKFLEESSDEDDYHDLVPIRTEHETRRATRARHSYADDSTDDEFAVTAEDIAVIRGDGPEIVAILSKTSDDFRPNYIVQMVHNSPVHATFITENELRNGNKTHAFLETFNRYYETSGEAVSNLGPDLVDPLSKPIDMNSFYVDRIVDSRRIGENSSLTLSKPLDPNQYIPGLPTERLPPIEDLEKYTNPFLSSGDGSSDEFLDPSGAYKVQLTSIIETQEMHQEVQEDTSIPENAEFLIKWRGQPQIDATWETPDSLISTPFCIANIAEYNHLVDLYWNNTRLRSDESELPIVIPDHIDYPGLTEIQENIIIALMNNYKSLGSIVVATPEGTGRSFAVIIYLHLLKASFKAKGTTLIVTKDVQLIILMLRVFTSLFWVEYTGPLPNLVLIRRDLTPGKFDVVVTTPDTISSDSGAFLSEFGWSHVIFDKSHGEYDNITDITGKSIIISPTSSGDIKICPEGESFAEYTETVHFVPISIVSTIHQELREQLKSKGSRASTMHTSPLLAEEIVQVHEHPCLIPHYKSTLIKEYKSRMGLSQMSDLNVNELMNFLGHVSSKLLKLVELIDRKVLTVVTGNSFAILRIIRNYLTFREYPAFLADSTINNEVAPQGMTSGIILMTRDFTNPRLREMAVSNFIFYDVGESIDDDMRLIQFWRSLNPQLVFQRILTNDSVELELYNMYLTRPHYLYTLYNPADCERLLKVAAVSTQPERTAELPAALSVQIPTPPGFQLPITYEELIQYDDFWDNVFAKSRVKHVKQTSWKKREIVDFVAHLATYGIGQWQKIAEIMNRSIDEVTYLGRAILVRAMEQFTVPGADPQNIALTKIASHGLLNSIIWFEFFKQPFERQFETPDFWHNYAIEDPLLQQGMSQANRALTQIGEAFMRKLVNNWVARTFLDLHSAPYLPFRYPQTVDDPELPGPDGAYKLLNAYIAHGWSAIEIKKALNLNTSPEQIELKLTILMTTCQMDIFSEVLRRKDDTDFISNPFIKPFHQAIFSGPQPPIWNEYEVSSVLKTLGEYGHIADTNEFYATTLITSKTPQQMSDFLPQIIAMIKNCRNREVIDFPLSMLRTDCDPDAPENQRPIRMFGAGKMMRQITPYYILMENIRTLIKNGLTEFSRPKVWPETWTIEMDLMLLCGICQFGRSHTHLLCRMVPREDTGIDYTMQKSLHEFLPLFPDQRSVFRRISFIALLHRPSCPPITFWAGQLRKIDLNWSAPPEQGIVQRITEAVPKVSRPVEKRMMTTSIFGSDPLADFIEDPAIPSPPIAPATAPQQPSTTNWRSPHTQPQPYKVHPQQQHVRSAKQMMGSMMPQQMPQQQQQQPPPPQQQPPQQQPHQQAQSQYQQVNQAQLKQLKAHLMQQQQQLTQSRPPSHMGIGQHMTHVQQPAREQPQQQQMQMMQYQPYPGMQPQQWPGMQQMETKPLPQQQQQQQPYGYPQMYYAPYQPQQQAYQPVPQFMYQPQMFSYQPQYQVQPHNIPPPPPPPPSNSTTGLSQQHILSAADAKREAKEQKKRERAEAAAIKLQQKLEREESKRVKKKPPKKLIRSIEFKLPDLPQSIVFT